MENLRDLWVEACEELWRISKDRPYIRSEATLWDAFRFLYIHIVNKDKTNGRIANGEVK